MKAKTSFYISWTVLTIAWATESSMQDQEGSSTFYKVSCFSLTGEVKVTDVLGEWFLARSWPSSNLLNASVLLEEPSPNDISKWGKDLLFKMPFQHTVDLKLTLRKEDEKESVLMLVGYENIGLFPGILLSSDAKLVAHVTVQLKVFGSYLLFKVCGYEKIFLLDRTPLGERNADDYAAVVNLLKDIQSLGV